MPALGPREIRHQVAHGQEEESEEWRKSPSAWEEVTAHREPVQHECRPGSGHLPGVGLLLVTPPAEQTGDKQGTWEEGGGGALGRNMVSILGSELLG